MRFLMEYDYPGNVRELRNIIERAVVIAKGDTINLEDIYFFEKYDETKKKYKRTSTGESLEEVERAHILSVLENITGISRNVPPF